MAMGGGEENRSGSLIRPNIKEIRSRSFPCFPFVIFPVLFSIFPILSLYSLAFALSDTIIGENCGDVRKYMVNY